MDTTNKYLVHYVVMYADYKHEHISQIVATRIMDKQALITLKSDMLLSKPLALSADVLGFNKIDEIDKLW